MISEAVDTAYTLGWALAVWIVLCAAVVTAGLYTLAVTVWAPVQAAREALSGALAAERALRALPEPHEARRAPDANTGQHVPAWAHTDHEEAA